MAHLEDSDRYGEKFRTGLAKGVDLPEQVRRLWAYRERDAKDIVKALEIAGREILHLKTQVAALKNPGGSRQPQPGLTPSRLEALSEKLRARAIAASRERG